MMNHHPHRTLRLRIFFLGFSSLGVSLMSRSFDESLSRDGGFGGFPLAVAASALSPLSSVDRRLDFASEMGAREESLELLLSLE